MFFDGGGGGGTAPVQPVKKAQTAASAPPSSPTANGAGSAGNGGSPVQNDTATVSTQACTATGGAKSVNANQNLSQAWSTTLGAGGYAANRAEMLRLQRLDQINGGTAPPPPDPQFGPLKASEVNNLWTDPGTGSTTYPATGVTRTDLGNGRVRFTFPDGKEQIQGINDANGNPVTYIKQGDNQWWNIDTQAAGTKIETDAARGVAQGNGQPASSGEFKGTNIKYEQYAAGPDGSQYSKITMPDGRTVDVYSETALPKGSLQNIASTVADAPKQTYAGVSKIDVYNQLGQVMGPDGKPAPIGGLAGGPDTNINVLSSELTNPNAAASTLNHEAGHVLDYQGTADPQFSTAQGSQFGTGQLAKNPDGTVDLSQSDYVSEYASRNPLEDFAETHRELTTNVRGNYSAENGGQELFDQPASDVSSYIDGKGYSPSINGKMMSIAERYGVNPNTTTGPSGTDTGTGTGTETGGTPDLPSTDVPNPAAATDASSVAEDASILGKLAPVAEKGGGVLAVAGGGFQIGTGINELRNGNTTNGALDVTEGALNTAGGAALASGVGVVAAPFLFGASSAIDGGRELSQGIQSGNAEQIGVGTAKMVGGGMMIAGGALCATGVGAPVGVALIAGGAVVSGGAALYDTFHTQINHAVGSAVNWTEHAASTVGNAVTTGAKDVGSTIASGASAAWNFVTSW